MRPSPAQTFPTKRKMKKFQLRFYLNRFPAITAGLNKMNDIIRRYVDRIRNYSRRSVVDRMLANLVLQFTNWQRYRKAWHFWGYKYSELFDIRALFVLFTVTKKIHLAQKIELNCEHFRAIIFYNFRLGLTQQQCIDELKSIFCD